MVDDDGLTFVALSLALVHIVYLAVADFSGVIHQRVFMLLVHVALFL